MPFVCISFEGNPILLGFYYWTRPGDVLHNRLVPVCQMDGAVIGLGRRENGERRRIRTGRKTKRKTQNKRETARAKRPEPSPLLSATAAARNSIKSQRAFSLFLCVCVCVCVCKCVSVCVCVCVCDIEPNNVRNRFPLEKSNKSIS